MFPDEFRDDVLRLETRRLWLRWPRMEDCDAITAFASDRRVAEMTALIPHPYPPGAAADYVAMTREANAGGRSLGLILTLKSDPDRAIGNIGLRATLPETLTLGYVLGVGFWGRGLMSEAVEALTDAAFVFTRVARLNATCLPVNAASLRVMGKAGYVVTGQGLISAPARGGEMTVDRLELDRATWAARGCARPARTSRVAGRACG